MVDAATQGRGPIRNVVGYGRRIPKVYWPGGARVAVSIVVGYEEGSEYSIYAGDPRNEGLSEFAQPINPTSSKIRDLCTESVWEYGSRSGIWRIARCLDEFKVKCTFFATAQALEMNPAVGEYIREAGHEPASHGLRFEEVWRLTREEERAHMLAAIKSIEKTCGERPRGWFDRCTSSVHTRELVVEEGGFAYDSNAYNDDIPYYVEVLGKQHLIVPYSFAYNDMRFILPGYSDPSSFFNYCKAGLDYLWDEGATFPRMMSIGLHPKWVGQAGRMMAVRNFLDYAMQKGDVWFARRIDIAEWWQKNFQNFKQHPQAS